jgi:histidinol-phosphate aminotransferase
METKLNRNENPYRSDGRLKALLAGLVDVDLAHYPDIDNTALIGTLSDHLGIPTAGICVGAGSSELISLIGTAFLRPGREAIVSSCTFELYQHVARVRGANAMEVPTKNYAHDLIGIASRAQGKADVVFIDNPCNPTGSFLSVPQIEDLLNRVDRGTLIVIDEAYIDFVETDGAASVAACIDRHANLMVVRTFSKAWGLAGLRFGYCLSQPENIRRLKSAMHPFSIGSLTQAVALAALADPSFVQKSVRFIAQERKKFAAALCRSRYWTSASATNFIFLNMGPDKDKLLASLARLHIRIREFSEYPGHVRISFGLPAHNDAVLGVLKKLEAEAQENT